MGSACCAASNIQEEATGSKKSRCVPLSIDEKERFNHFCTEVLRQTEPNFKIEQAIKKNPITEVKIEKQTKFSFTLKNKDNECWRYYGQIDKASQQFAGLGSIYYPHEEPSRLIVGYFNNGKPDGRCQVYDTVGNYEQANYSCGNKI